MAYDNAASQVQRDPNHIRIDSALENIGSSIVQLEKLVREMKNGPDGPQPAQPTAPRMTPTLASIINETPDRCNSYAKQIEALVDELRTILF